ncbi:MAG: GtrA family protein [Alphaproteobacteria bacterium]|nr:GtrA family protein [Alphaproteobacteria bacterium]
MGTIGFLVDAGVLALLTELAQVSPYWARAVSFPIALTATWYMHRRWTFATGRAKTAGRQYSIYSAVQIAGAAVNFAVYALALQAEHPFLAHPVIALAIGSLVAMFVTFALSRRFAFSA